MNIDKPIRTITEIKKGADKEMRKAIKLLQTALCVPENFPKELCDNLLIKEAQLILGIRIVMCKGYDVINAQFFIEENVKFYNNDTPVEKQETTLFDNFNDFFIYLQGDIYNNACYFGYDFSKEEIEQYNIDITQLTRTALIDYTINDFTLSPTKDERNQIRKANSTHTALKKWIELLAACDNYEQFKKLLGHIYRSPIAVKYLNILLCNYAYNNPEKSFPIIMEHINNTLSYPLEETMCFICNPQSILSAYSNRYYAPSTAKNHKYDLKKFITNLQSGRQQIKTESYYDKDIGFYVYKIQTTFNESPITASKCFDNFDDFAAFMNNDLSDCNLFHAKIPDLDTSKFIYNDDTVWPVGNLNDLCYIEEKGYNRFYKHFYVKQYWVNSNNRIFKKYKHTFKYFFDFAYFLHNDLSQANLLFCDGLANIKDFTPFNFDNAVMRSEIKRKANLGFTTLTLPPVTEHQYPSNNELQTSAELIAQRQPSAQSDELEYNKIYYVSDLHLLHRLHLNKCITEEDIDYTIQNLILSILPRPFNYKSKMLLIGGDTSSDFNIFKRFVYWLKQYIKPHQQNFQVIFTLGNHELWEFTNHSLNSIVEKYRILLNKFDMHLLQNNLLYATGTGIEEITEKELETISSDALFNRVKMASTIIFGGLAFAGKNNNFNANQGIYRKTLSRQQEIEESAKFEALYDKICKNIPDKNVIILTHTPKTDWSGNSTLQKKYVYVSGHSHKNYFYDDGDYRIYSDNQIGYFSNTISSKFFYLDKKYDIFERYADGIYEITADEYRNFYRGKNIQMTFTRPFHKLYMLKKNGYYMFVLQYDNGDLYILNGGNIKKLHLKSIEYFYNNMDKEIDAIQTPFKQFTKFQTEISDAVKAFGGSGNIHGAIVDIDYNNHIYVNPIDLTVTPYWAATMTYKIAYPSIPSLLKAQCPGLYLSYKRLENESTARQLIINNKLKIKEEEFYPDTDIYQASMQVKKMQRLNSNILTIWTDISTKKLSDKTNNS